MPRPKKNSGNPNDSNSSPLHVIRRQTQVRTTQGKIYFSKVHEDAIVQYAQTRDPKVRQDLYVKLIGPVFNEMVDKIVFTYKFTTLPNIDDLKNDCKIWLTTILDKFDPSKGSKAFSYFSVITKNWFIHKVKRNSNQTKREVYFEDIKKESSDDHLLIHNSYDADRNSEEFWDALWVEINDWEDEDLKQNDDRVLQAVKILLENPDRIEIFNKKAIYLYIREITNLNTKQIASSLNRLRDRYKDFKLGWENDIV
jgi:DNA-directed RNA polymerase specialized sigma subunit